MRLVSINNRIWAVGLHWRLASAQKLSRREFIEEAQSLDAKFDLICRHKKEYGFGESGISNSSNGANASSKLGALGKNDTNTLRYTSAHSLAAYLHMHDVIAIFKLEDIDGTPFWWVLAIRDNTIIGTGDRVFETEKEAEDAILNLNELFGTDLENTIICKNVHESLDWLSPHVRLNFLENLQGLARISPLFEDIQKKRQKTLICALIGIILFVGSWYIWSYYLEQKTLQEQHDAYLNREQIKRDLLNHPEKQFKQEWASLPLASTVANACIKAMSEIPTNSNGWSLNSLKCLAGKNLQLAWVHQIGGNFIYLPLKASLDVKNSKKALSRLKLDFALPLRPSEKHIDLLPTNTLKSIFYQICQATGTKVKISVKNPQKKTIDKIEIVSPWQKIDWTLSEIPSFLISDNTKLAQLLAKIPGLSLSQITFDNSKWTFKGSAYALK